MPNPIDVFEAFGENSSAHGGAVELHSGEIVQNDRNDAVSVAHGTSNGTGRTISVGAAAARAAVNAEKQAIVTVRAPFSRTMCETFILNSNPPL